MTSQVEVDNLRGVSELSVAGPEHRVVEAGAAVQKHKRGTLAIDGPSTTRPAPSTSTKSLTPSTRTCTTKG